MTSIYIFRFMNSCIDRNGRIHVIRPLVLYICFVDRCFSFCSFSFCHCVVCSSIYEFWLPLLAWNLCTGASLCECRSSTAYVAAVSIATTIYIAFFYLKLASDSNLLWMFSWRIPQTSLSLRSSVSLQNKQCSASLRSTAT